MPVLLLSTFSSFKTMEQYASRVAVVTGASTGIGAAIVKLLLENEMKVVGIARRKEKIEEIADEVPKFKQNLHALQVDVTNPDEISKAFKWIIQNVGPPTVLVNNAGVFRRASLIDGDPKAWKEVVDTNLMGAANACREAINIMRQSDVTNGYIINVNSILGHEIFNIPGSISYSISKYGITALTKQLRNELLGEKVPIRVCSLSPGYVETPLLAAAGCNTEDLGAYSPSRSLNSKDVAEAVKYVLSTNPRVEITELTIRPAGGVL